MVGPGDLAVQARQAFANVGRCLAAAGARPDQVARITIYVVGYRPECLPAIAAGRIAVFGDHRPTDTLLGVESLADPAFLIEVDAIGRSWLTRAAGPPRGPGTLPPCLVSSSPASPGRASPRSCVRSRPRAGAPSTSISPAWSEWVDTPDAAPGETAAPGRDWVWRADRVRELLAAAEGGPLFVSGCAANMGELLPHLDDVVLLTAPVDVIAARLAARPGASTAAVRTRWRACCCWWRRSSRCCAASRDHELDTEPARRGVARRLLALLPAARRGPQKSMRITQRRMLGRDTSVKPASANTPRVPTWSSTGSAPSVLASSIG